MKLKAKDRATDKLGRACTVKEVVKQEEKAWVLFDTQRPSSLPKLVSLKELRFISRP